MLELQEYPVLFRESDSCAIHSQREYFRLLKIKICLLLVTAAVASFSWNQEPSVRIPAAVVTAMILTVLMALSAIGDMKKFDRIWFGSRAIAESVKKESWVFMMKGKPYDNTVTDSVAEQVFLNRLKQIFQSQSSICSELASYSNEGDQITEHMKQMMRKPIVDRLTYYAKNRIHDQRLWYAKKANWNRTRESRWFIVTWILQVVAVILAFIIIGFKNLVANPVGILTTAGAGVLSWMTARSYRELSQSYGLIAQELSFLEERGEHVSTEEELSDIVLEVEQTISREHTIWLTKRLEMPKP